MNQKNISAVVDLKQKEISFAIKPEDETIMLDDFNQEECRLALAKMLIIDELPFNFLENESFKTFVRAAQPMFQFPSRWSIVRDCLKLFMDEKNKLKSILSTNSHMVSLTADKWTLIQNLEYICETAHYIGVDWKLNKKILTFCPISDHKGETIGKCLEKIIKEWGISKVCTVNCR
ncbi:hypothetical protein L6164_008121 [Bauhinia variegata]|uniref:Uncharacterized protein n=1 Tax=Bauhinia variegata TaxID=167791 RepID=A0ACB9PH31_BAUVA|nr:hypothetical protein L6164_008121 [Bauhinia variegata]